MKHLFFFLCLYGFNVHAQTDLAYTKRLIDCEDKWIALPMNKDSTFTYGFVYLDNMAGLTFHLGGTFKLNGNSLIVKAQSTNAMMKQRLAPTALKVAIIPKERFESLKIDEFPDWLKIYKGADTASIARLYKLAVTHNQWNEPIKALSYLGRANKIDPKHKGIAYEYAFAYNASKQYDKAIIVLDDALILSPNDCDLLKELMYAQMNLKQIDKAIETCKKAYQLCTQKNIKSEMLYNITYHYFKQKDKVQFKLWAEESKKILGPADNAMKAITKMESEIGL